MVTQEASLIFQISAPTVVAGVSPGVEGGILPPGSAATAPDAAYFQARSAGQDAQLFGRRDDSRYGEF
jgi:hypothetical protein